MKERWLAPLRPEELSGEQRIHWRPPAVEMHEDVLALPFVADGVWGVFDGQGRLIDASVDRRGAGRALVDQAWPPGLVDEAAADLLPEAEYVYAGRLIHHYGHFLLESLSRLWPWIHGGLRGRKLLVHPVGAPEFFANLPYAAGILGALGLSQDDFVVVDRPVRARRLLIPRPAFQVGASAHFAFRTLCRRLGRRLLASRPAPVPRRRRGPPIYLSKQWLVSGVHRLTNELELHAVLEQGGVQVVYPELMPLAEQVALWAERETVLGTVGSAFHTSLFAPPPKRMLGMLLVAQLDVSFPLIDRLNGNPARYFRPKGLESAPDDGRIFAERYRLSDPAAVGEALLRLLAR